MSWLLQGIGELGSQAGEGRDIALNWQERQQRLQMEKVKQQLDAVMLPLQIQEIQARIKKMGAPETKFLTNAQGGTDVVSVDPTGTVGNPRTVLPGAPKPLKQRYEEETDPEAKKKLGAELEEETRVTSHRTPLQDVQQDLLMAQASGDPQAIAAARKNLQDLVSTTAKPSRPTYWQNVSDSLLPGPAGDAARASLAEDDKRQEARLKARGLAFGQGRLYAMRTYVNAQGQLEDMTGFEYERRKAEGEALTPTGRLSTNTAVAYQRFKREGYPALDGVEKDLGAFDNAGDRAIFAKLLATNGAPPYTKEAEWMQNILDQALASGGLSAQGRELVINLSRLRETMGTLRASLALPATEASMNLTLSLLPGPKTPDAAFARRQLSNLRNIIDQAANVPIMQNLAPPAGGQAPPAGPNGPPPGAKIVTLDQLFPRNQ